jgi:hypothetical protein
MDVYERLIEEDAKQSSVIIASFAYHAAMRDEKIPRRALEGNPTMQAMPKASSSEESK